MRKSILLLALLFASSAFAQKYDIVIQGRRVMDPDRATYKAPMEASTGFHFVIVNGTELIRRGKLVPDTFPGKAL